MPRSGPTQTKAGAMPWEGQGRGEGGGRKAIQARSVTLVLLTSPIISFQKCLFEDLTKIYSQIHCCISTVKSDATLFGLILEHLTL